MLTLRLFCAAGMSTSLLEKRIRSAAEERGVQVDVSSYSINAMDDHLDGADVVLLSPQVRFIKPHAHSKCAALGIPLDVIPFRDYGTVNGDNVLDLAFGLLGQEG